MKNIILFSFFNSNNIGDKAISDYFYRSLQSKYNVICCSNEGNFDINGSYESERLVFFEKVKRKICIALGIRYQSPLYKIFLKKYKSLLETADLVILGGGNLLMDYARKSSSYQKILDYVKVANKKNVSVYALSIGIGPFATNRQLEGAVDVLNMCDYVSFRDQSSYDLYVQNGGNSQRSVVSIDPVFALPQKTIENPVQDKGISINIIDPFWFGEKYREAVRSAYINFIKHLSDCYPSTNIFLFATEKSDVAFLNDICRIFEGNDKINEVLVSDLFSLQNLYLSSSLVIGARMHSLIIAFASYVRVIGLSWSQKVDSFFDIIGHSESVVPIEQLGENISYILDLITKEEQWDFDVVRNKADLLLMRDMKEIE